MDMILAPSFFAAPDFYQNSFEHELRNEAYIVVILPLLHHSIFSQIFPCSLVSSLNLHWAFYHPISRAALMPVSSTTFATSSIWIYISANDVVRILSSQEPSMHLPNIFGVSFISAPGFFSHSCKEAICISPEKRHGKMRVALIRPALRRNLLHQWPVGFHFVSLLQMLSNRYLRLPHHFDDFPHMVITVPSDYKVCINV